MTHLSNLFLYKHNWDFFWCGANTPIPISTTRRLGPEVQRIRGNSGLESRSPLTSFWRWRDHQKWHELDVGATVCYVTRQYRVCLFVCLFSHCKRNPPGIVLICFPCGKSEEKATCLILLLVIYVPIHLLMTTKRKCLAFPPLCWGEKKSPVGMAVTLGRPPADLPFLQVDWFICGSSY